MEFAMSRRLSLAFVLGLVALMGSSALADIAPPPPMPAPDPTPISPTPIAPAPVLKPVPVDLVICLDTSGSMQGLIDAARQKLWSVVSELATATPTPDLRVALLTYGSPGNNATGHVVLQSDLTRDLDLISEKLFALGTRGGEEYVGRVVAHALTHLSWSGPLTLKVLFVAGNESADQDSVKPFREQAKAAASRGITVNAIYCGGADDGDASGYRELASLGKGRFAHIDHNHGTVAVTTPYDAELAKLSAEINKTYVAYGSIAKEAVKRQVAQDANAEAAGAPAAAERASAKAGGLYRNSAWDLVDRMGEEGFDLDAIPVKDLPEEMQEMKPDARLAYLQKKKADRAAIRARIQELTKQRDAFVRAEMDKKQLDDSRALDRALKDAIREQAARAGFEFEGAEGAK
jgi:hypothetical protein